MSSPEQPAVPLPGAVHAATLCAGLSALPEVAPPPGSVSLVGAGPGDPELLTVRAARRIASADVLVYDALVDKRILSLAAPHAEQIYVGKESSNHTLVQEEINRLLVRLAREGKRVVRLKGGDPFVFGRGGEEMQELFTENLPVEIVPGITAALGMASATGIPLTHRDHAQACMFVTGHRRDGTLDLDWPALMREHQTVVIYMGVLTLPGIVANLRQAGLRDSKPIAVVQHATKPQQRVVTGTLADIAERVQAANIRPPALIVIGDVVQLYTGPQATAPVAAGSADSASDTAAAA